MRVIRILAVWAFVASCARDAPLAPGSSTDPATEQFAALAVDLADAQKWLLPNLGHGYATSDAIAGRFADLATSLERGDTAVFVERIAAARQELGASTAGELGEHFIQLAALGLVLDDVEAVIQGRVRLVSIDAAAPTAPDPLSERSSRQSNRSRP